AALGWVVSLRHQVRHQTEQMRQQLRREANLEARYRDLFEHAHDAVYTLDPEGRFTSLNRAAESLTGFARQELLGRTLASLAAPGQEAAAERLLLAPGAGDSPTPELTLRTKTGRPLVAQVSPRPLVPNGPPPPAART